MTMIFSLMIDMRLSVVLMPDDAMAAISLRRTSGFRLLARDMRDAHRDIMMLFLVL